MAEDLFANIAKEQAQIDPAKDYLPDLVGDDKPFKTPQALARAKVESDLHIKRLEAEMAEMRVQVGTQLTMQEFLDKVEAAKKAGGSQPPPIEPGNQSGADGNGSGNQKTEGLSKDDVLGILNQQKEADTQARNADAVRQALEASWGPDYQKVLRGKLQELGVSEKFLNDMAKTQPLAFIKLVGAEAKKPSDRSVFTPVGSVVNSAVTPGNTEKNEKYYTDLRQTNPKEYFTERVQMERWKQAKKLGDAFFS